MWQLLSRGPVDIIGNCPAIALTYKSNSITAKEHIGIAW